MNKTKQQIDLANLKEKFSTSHKIQSHFERHTELQKKRNSDLKETTDTREDKVNKTTTSQNSYKNYHCAYTNTPTKKTKLTNVKNHLQSDLKYGHRLSNYKQRNASIDLNQSPITNNDSLNSNKIFKINNVGFLPSMIQNSLNSNNSPTMMNNQRNESDLTNHNTSSQNLIENIPDENLNTLFSDTKTNYSKLKNDIEINFDDINTQNACYSKVLKEQDTVQTENSYFNLSSNKDYNLFDDFWPGENQFYSKKSCCELISNPTVNKLMDHFVRDKFDFYGIYQIEELLQLKNAVICEVIKWREYLNRQYFFIEVSDIFIKLRQNQANSNKNTGVSPIDISKNIGFPLDIPKNISYTEPIMTISNLTNVKLQNLEKDPQKGDSYFDVNSNRVNISGKRSLSVSDWYKQAMTSNQMNYNDFKEKLKQNPSLLANLQLNTSISYKQNKVNHLKDQTPKNPPTDSKANNKIQNLVLKKSLNYTPKKMMSNGFHINIADQNLMGKDREKRESLKNHSKSIPTKRSTGFHDEKKNYKIPINSPSNNIEDYLLRNINRTESVEKSITKNSNKIDPTSVGHYYIVSNNKASNKIAYKTEKKTHDIKKSHDVKKTNFSNEEMAVFLKGVNLFKNLEKNIFIDVKHKKNKKVSDLQDLDDFIKTNPGIPQMCKNGKGPNNTGDQSIGFTTDEIYSSGRLKYDFRDRVQEMGENSQYRTQLNLHGT